MKCDRCGKEMTSGKMNIIGIHFSFKLGRKKKHRELYKQQLGKYANKKKYSFCWECWLDSIFQV